METPLAAMLAASLCFWGGVWGCKDWGTSGDDDSVVAPSLLGIGVTPIDPKVTVSEPIQFIATGYYADRTTRDLTSSVDWWSSDSAVVAVSSDLDLEGRGTPQGAGVAKVGCQYFDLASNEVRVTVTEATVESLTVAPGAVTLHAGETVQLVAEATFSDGSHGNVTGSVRWLTSDGTVATVDAGGVALGEGLGTASIDTVYEQGETPVAGNPVTVQVVGDDVSIDQADVRIVGLSVASSGTDVTYTAELKNSGGSPASGFWLDVWLNRTAAPPPPPATGDGYQFVDVLAAGETAEVTVTIYGVNPGTYQSWLLVDSVGSVSEGSLGENNNLWGPEAVTVTGSGDPIGADLSITYLVAYIQESQGQVIYIVDVTNSGDQAAEGFAVGVFSNPEFPPTAPAVPDEQAAVEYLAPGETAYLDVVVRALPEGSWSSWVLADVASAVPEPNESNNLQGFEVAPE